MESGESASPSCLTLLPGSPRVTAQSQGWPTTYCLDPISTNASKNTLLSHIRIRMDHHLLPINDICQYFESPHSQQAANANITNSVPDIRNTSDQTYPHSPQCISLNLSLSAQLQYYQGSSILTVFLLVSPHFFPEKEN